MASQRVISSYFSQPSKSSTQPKASHSGLSTKPIDLTLSDSEPESQEPPTKRTRIQNDEPYSKERATSSSSPPPAESLLLPSMSQKWSFTPVTKATSASKSSRSGTEIEAFRKKMRGDVTKPFKKAQGKKRQRDAIDIGEASEGNTGEELRSNEDEEGEGEGGEEDEDEVVSNRLSKFAITKRGESGDNSNGKGSTLKAARSSYSKGRGSKKPEEIGPAGLKYTPLEKQVSYLHSWCS
jgi:DNA mismatch repair protein MSH3